MEFSHRIVAIVPCVDLDASRDFYERLGFAVTSDYALHGYRILHDRQGASLHLTRVDAGAVEPERTVCGLYFYTEEIDTLAAEFGCRVETKPWGLREFAVSDPSGTLVRIGWPAQQMGTE